MSKGNASGLDVRHAETLLSAGRNLRIDTGGALTLQGAQARGDRINITAADLAIISEQDTSTYASNRNCFSLELPAAYFGSNGSFCLTVRFGAYRNRKM